MAGIATEAGVSAPAGITADIAAAAGVAAEAMGHETAPGVAVAGRSSAWGAGLAHAPPLSPMQASPQR